MDSIKSNVKVSDKKKEIITSLKMITDAVNGTIPFHAEKIADKAAELFKLRLEINKECLGYDVDIIQAFAEATEAFKKIVEYHAGNFAKL